MIQLFILIALVENMVKKNRSHFSIAVLLTTVLKQFFRAQYFSIMGDCRSIFQLIMHSSKKMFNLSKCYLMQLEQV